MHFNWNWLGLCDLDGFDKHGAPYMKSPPTALPWEHEKGIKKTTALSKEGLHGGQCHWGGRYHRKK